MARTRMMTRLGMAMIGLFGMLSVGCGGSSLKKFDVNIALDQAMPANETVTVDLVALGGDRAKELENMSMRKYWTLSDPYRAGLLAAGEIWTTELSSSDPSALLKSTERAYWNSPTWKSGQTLFVLAKLRGVGPGPTGDPRRRTIDRDSSLWSQKRIDVTVRPTGISYSPTEKSAGR